jgi:hypothetical protein
MIGRCLMKFSIMIIKKIIIAVSILYVFSFSIDANAQSSVSDSLESVTIKYIDKHSNHNLDRQGYVMARFYSLLDKYVIYIVPMMDKLCRENNSLYKIQNIDGLMNVYFFNNFMNSITLNEDNAHFFLTDEECEEAKGILYHTNLIMLLVDNKFSIEKEVKGINSSALIEDLLCPTAPSSIERARIIKKYGHL